MYNKTLISEKQIFYGGKETFTACIKTKRNLEIYLLKIHV
jgi:hypothetical protein